MAATDVLSLEEAKAVVYRSAGNTSDDLLIQAMLTAVSNYLDQQVGPIVQRTVTEAHDGGSCYVELGQAPVAGITSVIEWDDGASATLTEETVAQAGDYLLTPWPIPDPGGLYGPRIERRSSRSTREFASGRGNIVVTYTAGRYATTEEVSATRFGEVARLAIGYMMKRRDVRLDDEWTSFFPATVPQIWAQLLGADALRQRLVIA